MKDLITLALLDDDAREAHPNYDKETGLIVVDLDLHIDALGKSHHVYQASIVYREIVLYSDNGVLIYLVDSYGDRHVIELIDWDEVTL